MTVDLSTLETPGPTKTKITIPFWDAVEEGKLLLQHCKQCDTKVFYPRTICPQCWSNQLDWIEASGDGILKSFSIVYKPGHPAWLPVTPYIVGLVELEEGPTMLSYIISDPSKIDTGAVSQKVKLEPTNISGRILPAFKLLELT